MGPLIPLFRAAIFTLGRGICDVHSLRLTSGVTPADLLTASMVAGHCSPDACFSRGRMLDLNGRPPAQCANHLTTSDREFAKTLKM